MTIRKRKLFRSIICKKNCPEWQFAKKLSRMIICQKSCLEWKFANKRSTTTVCKYFVRNNNLQTICLEEQFVNLQKNNRQLQKNCSERKIAKFEIDDPQCQYPKSGLKENLQHFDKITHSKKIYWTTICKKIVRKTLSKKDWSWK